MADERRQRWQQRYAESSAASAGSVAEVLHANRHLLPARGRSLDLACGLGGSALLLAELGFDSHAWDYADSAIQRLQVQAAERGLAVHAEARDVLAEPPAAASFDVIVVSRFLERALCPAIAAALRPGGLLFYQTFTRDKPGDAGPSRRDFLLAPNEFLALFPTLRVVHYREDARYGDLQRGERSEAWLIGAQEVGCDG